jgi:hypothetical protein
MHVYLTCLAAVLTASGTASAQQSTISIYTDISSKACTKHIDDQATGAYTLNCAGVHGFRLQVHEDDERSSISLVTPDKRVIPLDYWDVVTRGFSTLGDKVEWRIAKIGGQAAPVAIIVRVNAVDQSNPERPKRVPLLAVAKISRDVTCVTQVVNALAPGANKKARRFSNDQDLACLSTESAKTQPPKG